jgi:ADP-heptose:LPS heptosyltransferase
LSESTSCSDRARRALELLRHGALPSPEELHTLDELRTLGEECPGEFFSIVIESLADSFDPRQSDAYDYSMRAWDLHRLKAPPAPPEHAETVYVLSRVTLGADIKITSMVLDAMKRRFPNARIVFVAGRKSIELFEADTSLEFMEAAYPRKGPVSERIAFGHQLRAQLNAPRALVVDPDSRMSQLGLIPLAEPGRYFHFPSRTAGGQTLANLSTLTADWLERTFGVTGQSWIAPRPCEITTGRPAVAISLGVGENESKRIPGDFEARLIRHLADRCATIHLDRGAGGEEARRVTDAAEASGALHKVRFHEGSFAAFVSIIIQSDFYAGYDSAGQHAAAAAGIPLITIFKGAPNQTFRSRWEPFGPAKRTILDAEKNVPSLPALHFD